MARVAPWVSALWSASLRLACDVSEAFERSGAVSLPARVGDRAVDQRAGWWRNVATGTGKLARERNRGSACFRLWDAGDVGKRGGDRESMAHLFLLGRSRFLIPSKELLVTEWEIQATRKAIVVVRR
jgi:hypothetical protein